MRIALVPLILLAGCVELPDTGIAPEPSGNGPWPTLKPIDEIAALQPEAGPEAYGQLGARGTELDAQGGTIRRESADQEGIRALRGTTAR